MIDWAVIDKIAQIFIFTDFECPRLKFPFYIALLFILFADREYSKEVWRMFVLYEVAIGFYNSTKERNKL